MKFNFPGVAWLLIETALLKVENWSWPKPEMYFAIVHRLPGKKKKKKKETTYRFLLAKGADRSMIQPRLVICSAMDQTVIRRNGTD